MQDKQIEEKNPNINQLKDLINVLQMTKEFGKIIVMDMTFYKCIRKMEINTSEVKNLIRETRHLIFEAEWLKIANKAEQLFNKTQNYRMFIVQFQAYIFCDQDPKLIIECLEKALKLKPQSKRLNLQLGNQYYDLKNYEKALEFYQVANQKRPSYKLLYKIGLIYQCLEQHELAIQYFTKAGDQNVNIYISKMDSFEALKQYDQALECCLIVISMEPQEAQYYLKQIYLLERLGRQDQIQQVKEKLQNTENFYTEKFFYEKRNLETQKVLLQKKQSQIGLKLTKSQIITSQQSKSIKLFIDSFFYTFTMYLVEKLQLIDLNQALEDIKKYINDQQIEQLKDFNEIMAGCLKSVIPNFEEKQIQLNLKLWYQKKIEKNLNNKNEIQYLQELFGRLSKQNEIQIIITDRINEDYKSIINRQNKNKNFQLQLLAFSQIANKQDSMILKSNEGQLGFEYSVLLLAYLVSFTKLADDHEDFETLIFRFFVQKDLEQFQISQSNIKISQENQKNKQGYNELTDSEIRDPRIKKQLQQFQLIAENDQVNKNKSL
ncbi:unnamed protein product [Paramecium sonneborni]|uniref:Tetratricopeptide repeat protein n=1 Tax=Paramecium sonneborni TaxID=65129 RepID=A0A8S1NA20_9CILI|nr:unnamed protein product [Paramecium sonneborni]